MIRITIACVGKLKEKYLRDAEAEFTKRLGAYCQLETRCINEEKMPDNASPAEESQILARETERVLKLIPEHSYVVLLDLKGKEISSPGRETGPVDGGGSEPPDLCDWWAFRIYG